MSKDKILIIGGGVSGLTCAIELEKKGYSPVIVDANKEVGGRLYSELIDGFVLDKGFQVLLTAYPAVKEYLDVSALDLNHFSPGAAIFKQGSVNVLGDPIRNTSFLLPLLRFPHASLADKFKIWRLSNQLKSESVEQIFEKPATSTLAYLRDKGFSEQVIRCFFKPFYSGIFLENELSTSSRMFEFVFKMFAEGYATVPAAGIQEIALQLKGALSQTTFKLGQPVRSVEDKHVVLDDGTRLDFDKLIMATNHGEDPQEKDSSAWQACWNLYFETDELHLDPRLIGLNANGSGLINNFSFMHSDSGSIGISVTVVEEYLGEATELASLIEEELWTVYGINAKRLIKAYHIPYALPKHEACTYVPSIDAMQRSSDVIVCGDSLANSSLNAAMLSGALAAKLV